MTVERRTFLRLAFVFITIIIVIDTAPQRAIADTPGASLLPIRDARFKDEDTQDQDLGLEKSYSPPKASRVGRATKPSSRMHGQKQFQRFWRQYRFARPEPKTKPLEREK